MEVLVPFDARDPKTRLEPVMDAEERERFARASLVDVLEAVAGADCDPTVLATAPVADVPAPVTVDDRPLSVAVNAALADRTPAPVAVVAADVPLVTPETVERAVTTDGDVVVVPGRGGGTNALVVRDPSFRADFHGVSCRDHRAIARDLGVEPSTVDSYRLSTDVDEPADLPEVLLHGRGRAREVLADVGFTLAADGGRVRLRRRGEPADV